jgi:hypothetical protein
MRTFDIRAVLLAALVALPCRPLMAWPSVPLPAGSTGETVSRHLTYNGIDMRASQFTTGLPLDDVIAFYARHWPGQHVVDKLGAKTVVGHAEDGHYVTIELQANAGATTGTIGVVKLPGSARVPVMGQDLYRPAGTQVLSDIEHHDGPGENRTVVMRNRLSPYVNLQHFVQRLGPQGWRHNASGTCKPGSAECVAAFEHADGRAMVITMVRQQDNATSMVVNSRKETK